MVAGPVTGLEWSEPMKQAQSVLANIQPQIDHQPDHTTALPRPMAPPAMYDEQMHGRKSRHHFFCSL
jgi:hypothetical protein